MKSGMESEKNGRQALREEAGRLLAQRGWPAFTASVVLVEKHRLYRSL